MAAPKIVLTGTPERTARPTRIPVPELGWELLGWIGLAFVLIGGVDLLLTWYPPAFGSPEWEFGTVASTLNALPLPSLGLMLIMAAGVAQGRVWMARGASVAMIVLVFVLIAIAVLFITVVPLALQSVPNPLARTGILKVIAKSSVLLVIYPALFTWVALLGFRRTRAA
jgi:hypothetical protein